MRALSIVVLMSLAAGRVIAEPPVPQSLTQKIPGAKAKYGLDNFKMVMPGVLYRGGGTGPRTPLATAPLQALCNEGFSAAVYVYGKGWRGARSVNCGNGQLTYVSKRWDHLNEQREILEELHDIIQRGRGAMYVHCWYGVHASGYIVATALMQFCGLSSAQAVAYWNSNVPRTIQYPKVQARIRAFKPYSDLQISAAERTRVCPDGAAVSGPVPARSRSRGR